jgi:6-phosphogluconolactonase/glucosamine-6-phosphate isomerase/deaminase
MSTLRYPDAQHAAEACGRHILGLLEETGDATLAILGGSSPRLMCVPPRNIHRIQAELQPDVAAARPAQITPHDGQWVTWILDEPAARLLNEC